MASHAHAKTLPGRSPSRGPGSPRHVSFIDIKSSIGEQSDSRKVTAPFPVFGTDTRSQENHGGKAPGPGEYTIPSSIGKPVLSTMAQAPACTISGREKFGSTADLSNSAKTPGPGDYNTSGINPREQTAPSYSLGKKWSPTKGEQRVPGPGAYDASTTIGHTVLSTQKSNPASSFAQGERKPLHTSGGDVGPGQYSVIVDSVGRQAVSTNSSAAAYSFGTDVRGKTPNTNGNYRYYDPKSSFGKQGESMYRSAPGCTMSGRTKFGSQLGDMSDRPMTSPSKESFTVIKSSVGEQVDSRKATAPGAVFGSSSRPKTTSGSQAPGPGAYKIPSSIGQAQAYTISGREKFGSTADLSNSAKTPGPGDYNTSGINPREQTAPSYSLGKKWSPTKGEQRVPGPGAYDASTTIGHTVLSTQKSNPASSFAQGERKPLHTSGGDVGPGQYSVIVDSVGRQAVSTNSSAAAYSFGTDVRGKTPNTNGNYRYYDPKSSFGKQGESMYRSAPGCTMSGRTKFGSQLGDMSDRPMTSPSKESFTVIKSSVGEQVDSRKATAPGAVFGSSSRPKTTSGSQAPGPGAYKIPSSIGQAQAYTISGREKFGSTADLSNSAKTPGPGDYNTSGINPREQTAPSYSLGKKWSPTKGEQRVPGPGAYDASTTIGHTVLSTQKSNPASSFAQGERKPLHTSGGDVGPGQYSVIVDSVGRQAVSTNSSAAAYSFGTDVRGKTPNTNGNYRYYDPKSSFGKQGESMYRSAPGCTMSGRTKFGSQLGDMSDRPMTSPSKESFTVIKSSVGEQVDSRKATAPGAVFGSSSRPKTTSGSQAPGPGAYKIPSSIGQAQAYTISGREKFGSTADLSNSAKTPGPGDYNTSGINPREQTAPSYSLGKKWSPTKGEQRVPGPGAYDASTTIGHTVLSTQKSNPASSFAQGERKPLHTSGGDVGPGQYSVIVDSVGRQAVSTNSSAAAYSFGTDVRGKTPNTNGNYRYYDPKSSFGKQGESMYRSAPGCTMSGRTKFGSQLGDMSDRPMTSPSKESFTVIKSSVGEQVDSRKATAPGAVFGSSSRPKTTSGSQAPGPGAYKIPSSIGQAQAYTISGREKFGSTADLSNSAKTPGPGDYNTSGINPREQTAPSYSLGKKWSPTKGEQRVPGPGAYDASTTIGHTVLSTQKSNPASSFAQGERKPLHTSGGDVGPGQYSVIVDSVGRQAVSTNSSAAAYSFGTDVRGKTPNTNGNYRYYDPKSSFGKQGESMYRSAPGCTMSGRTKFGSQLGDMSDRPMTSPSKESFTVIKSSVGEQVDSRKATAPGAVFGSSSRPKTTSGSQAPGPGAYKIPSSIGQAQAYTISGREKFGSTADLSNSAKTPGPGDYNTSGINPREQTAPSYSLGKKWSPTKGEQRVPGPGAYDASTTIGHTVLSTQKSNPASSFAQGERKPLHTSGGDVGPGQYSVIVDSVGRQAVSTNSSAAAYSFGTDVRGKTPNTNGNYRYYDPKSSFGKQGESMYRSAPGCTMSGRTKFGSQLGDMSDRPMTSPSKESFTVIKSSVGEQVDSRKATAPGAVFGSSSRPKTTSGSQAPGPGAYKIPSSIGQAQAYTISGREKFGSTADLSNSAKTPGPGDYNTSGINPREQTAPSYSLGKKWSPTKGEQRVPGPGAYDASTTIGHTVLSTQKSNPASSFAQGERKPLHTSGGDVGPGQYSVIVDSVGRQAVSTNSSAAAYSFGTDVRGKTPNTNGNYRYYDPKSSFGKQGESMYRSAPGCTMSGRTKFGSQLGDMSDRPMTSPSKESFTVIKSSVGEQVDSRKATAPGAVFGSSSRPKTTSGSQAPGPGAYKIPSSIGQAQAYTISGREKFGSTADLSNSAKTPGPGDYNTSGINPREQTAPSYSLGKKWSPTKGEQRVPGPGAYDASTTIGHTVLSTQKSNPASSFAQGERKPLHTSGGDVGPGQYSVIVDSVGRQAVSTNSSAAAYSFGTDVRGKTPNTNGNYRYYDPKSSFGKQGESMYRSAPGCTMSGRTKFGSQLGDMSDRPMTSPSKESFTVIKSSVGEQVDSRKATAPGAVFGSSSRPKTTSGSQAPGPGAYKIPSSIGQAQAYTISGREKFGSTADLSNSAKTPGPGDYNTSGINPREQTAPSYSLGKKWSPTKGEQRVPGPGAYDASTTIGHTVLSTQKSNPASSFAQGERKPLHTSGGDVGPGQYSVVVDSVGRQAVSTAASGAAYSFGTDTRSKDVGDNGSYKYYDPKSSFGKQDESMYRSAPGASMSGRTKFGSHI